MSKVFHWQAGSLLDKVSGNALTNTDVMFKQTEKGMAGIALNSSALLNAGEVPVIRILDTFSIVLAIKDNGSGNKVIYETNDNDGFSLQRDTTSKLRLNITGATASQSLLGTKLINDNTWLLIVITADLVNDTVKFYINNVLDATNTGLTAIPDYAAADLYLFSRNSIATIEGAYIKYIKHYNTILTETERNQEYQEFLHSFPLAIAKDKFLPYPDLVDGSVSFFEDFRYEPADGTNILPKGWIKGTGSYKISELTIDDTVLTSLKKGTKVLECLTIGTILFQSKQEDGTFEFTVKNPTNTSHYWTANIISSDNLTYDTTVGPRFSLIKWVDNAVYFVKKNGAVPTVLWGTNAAYLDSQSHDFKITRTNAGIFTVWIRGGIFGNQYQVIVPTLGSNPVTEATIIDPIFSVFESNIGGWFTKIKYTKGIEL